VAALRRFTCYDCGKGFDVPYGTGVPGHRMKCPACGGNNVHRAAGYRDLDRLSQYSASPGRADGTGASAAGFYSGRGTMAAGAPRAWAGRRSKDLSKGSKPRRSTDTMEV